MFRLEVDIVEKDDRLDVCPECGVLPKRLEGIISQVGEKLDTVSVLEIDGWGVGDDAYSTRGYAKREK